MALSGLQIQKLLPKTNCKECGCSTCLAFAMKLAARKAELKECPYVSDEAKAILGAAAEPPIRTVTLGSGDAAFKTGGETVSYRHEKTFVNPTGLGVAFADTLEPAALEAAVRKVREYALVRVGETLRVNAVSLTCESGDPARFAAALLRVAALWERALIARSDDPAILRLAAEKMRGRKILLASATPATVAELGELAASTGAALAVTADDLDALTAMVKTLGEKKFRDILLELRAGSLSEHFQNNTVIRRAALKGVKPLGYPVLKFVRTGNAVDDAVEAGLEIVKYGGLAVLPEFDPAVFVTLLTLRQNIYTDPQKPIQVEPKVYAIGEPNENSPVFVTTNFSLTYFIVSGEIENCGISSWLVVPECEGMSVLTAWAAGKFSGATIAKFIKDAGFERQVTRRDLVIPGYVAQISGELEENLPGWKVLVGPQEAGDL
ncbi:MAG: acetyl-CoA decarbonylase/synthase complex subunit gamma, partial [Planctomycetota bacterium]|nr:acetyl-CoA decarbonylase/synthase complex subunit gamma [Planctomycetota bacterium]